MQAITIEELSQLTQNCIHNGKKDLEAGKTITNTMFLSSVDGRHIEAEPEIISDLKAELLKEGYFLWVSAHVDGVVSGRTCLRRKKIYSRQYVRRIAHIIKWDR